MGRYILLEIDDNKAADAVMALMERLGDPKEEDLKTLGAMLGAHANVTAVYTKPAGLCSCKSDLDNSLRGKKFGWWVCPTCKKPKNGSGQTLRNTLNPKLENTTRVGSPSLSVRWKFVEGKVVTSIES